MTNPTFSLRIWSVPMPSRKVSWAIAYGDFVINPTVFKHVIRGGCSIDRSGDGQIRARNRAILC